MLSQTSRKQASEAPVIPDRLYFKIGDVARICGEETYVLRFWETQFPQLKPNKSGTGQRLYRRRDVELVVEIQSLLHKQGFTIPGARQVLESGASRSTPMPEPVREIRRAPRSNGAARAIAHARAELKEIAAMLANPLPAPKRDRQRVLKAHPESASLFPL